MEVVVEFLRRLNETVTRGDPDLVLRGSLLLRCWFGARARPAADVDLECFERRDNRGDTRFSGSPVAHARALCIYAASEWRGSGRDRGGASEIDFEPIDPEDGTDLWDYGTPGERCYTLWVAHHLKDAQGRLQIDLAQAGSYDLGDIGVEALELSTPLTPPFRFRAYTPEMMLAAKLSWFVRSLKRRVGPDGAPAYQWDGQPKDLFDAHLLLSRADLRTDELQRGLYAVGAEDRRDWLDLEEIFDAAGRMHDGDFADWEGFRRQHEAIVDRGPAEMLRDVADRLWPILDGFLGHIPFLRAIDEDPEDEMVYLIYADWLESRGDPRHHLLRLYVQWALPAHKPTLASRARRLLTTPLPPDQEMSATRRALLSAMETTPAVWLYRVFGGRGRFRRIRERIEAAEGVSRRRQPDPNRG